MINKGVGIDTRVSGEVICASDYKAAFLGTACSHERCFHYLFACLMSLHLLIYLHLLSLTSLPNQFYCSLGIMDWFLMARSYGYPCLPDYQCEALYDSTSKLGLLFYLHTGLVFDGKILWLSLPI